MLAKVILIVDHVESVSSSGTVCIVRCLCGVLTKGQTLQVFDSTEGLVRGSTQLATMAIWRYEKPAEILDPPHVAKILLDGSLGNVDLAKKLVGD